MKAKPKTAPAPASQINLRAEIDKQLAQAKAKRTGSRGAAIPGVAVPAPQEPKRSPGRPRTAPEPSQPPKRSPAKAARLAAIAGVKDLLSLAALPFPTLSIPEAATILGCSKMHVSNCLDSGELVALNIGRPGGARACNRILKASLEAFIAKRGGASKSEADE